MLNDTHTFFASCPRGLEPVLTAELERLGAGQVRAGQGGVAFSGEFAMCYRVNLDSRIASRVLWKIYHGRYRDEEEIYTSVFALPWSDWFSEQETIKVKVSAQLPAARGAEQEAPAPSSTVTLPLGEPAPGATTETTKLTVTGCPTTEALGLRFETESDVSALST